MRWIIAGLAGLLLQGCASSLVPPAGEPAVRPTPVGESTPTRVLPAELSIEKLAVLPAELQETSGLALHQGRLWSLNDGGNGPWLYQVDQQGAVAKRVRLADAVNLDWESMAADEQHLYVADCGNNSGRRAEFQLYRVAWSALDASPVRAAVKAERQVFSFADADVVPRLHKHDNDCEAITRVGDELWLLTKGWVSQTSRLYRLDPQAPGQSVRAVQTLRVRGLVTAADYSSRRRELAILGYTRGTLFVQSFLWLVPVRDNAPDWSGAHRMVLTPAGQWEGIVWQDDSLLLSRERSLLGDTWLGRITPPAPLAQ